MANEIKKINVDGKEYNLGGGGAGQELISQDDITFNETISDEEGYIIEIADEDINNKYVNIELSKAFSKMVSGGEDTPRIKFNNPKNATLTFIYTEDSGCYLDSIFFYYNTLLKAFTRSLYSNVDWDYYVNYLDNNNSLAFINRGTPIIVTLKFDAFGYLAIHQEGIGEV